MITIRPSEERGKANFGWLNSKHTFSFGSYYDPRYMEFGDLRVINEDIVQGGEGFGTHGHRDMEIVTYVLEGELAHKDSIGNGSVIRPGDVQRMSAGTGITHSEFNGDNINEVHFLQIWIKPQELDITPSYEEKHFPLEEKLGKLRLLVSPDGRDNSLKIHQDTYLYGGVFKEGDRLDYNLPMQRNIWIQVAKGVMEVNGELLNTGDGAGIILETNLQLLSKADNTEILLFDLQ
jgi:quercetin 2,3-dioxygenase